MKPEEIIELAKKAGIATGGHPMIPWSVYTTTLESLLALHRQALIDSGELVPREKVEADGCVCKGNWRELVKQYTPLFDRHYKKDNSDEIYRFCGLVHAEDDYYFCMLNLTTRRTLFLSCVGDIEGFGYTLFDRARSQP